MSGFSAKRAKSDLTLREEASRDAAALLTLCRVPGCDWALEATAGEGRDAAREHRRAAHPELPVDYVRPKPKKKPEQKPAPPPAPHVAAPVVAPPRPARKPAPHVRAPRPERPRRRRVETQPRQTMLTPVRLEVAKFAYIAGYSVRDIGTLAHEAWGYKTAASCTNCLQEKLREVVVMRPRGGARRNRLVSLELVRTLVQDAK